MKKILYSLFLLVVLIPLGVRALNNSEVLSVNVEENNNVISFTGTTEPESYAVMCKLYDSDDKEVAKYSVEVSNQAFAGNFIAPETGNYTVSCANYSGGTIVSKNATVEAMAIYTINFDARGGNLTSSASVNVTHGETLEEPTDPVLEGKIFGGWCVDETATTLFDFSTKITTGMTLYARWTDPITQVQIIYGGDGAFKVDFDTNNPDDQGTMGSFVAQSQRYFVTTGNTVTLTAEVPEGQHFDGWYTTQEEEDPNNPGHTIWTNVTLLSEETTYEFETEGLFVNIKPVFAQNEGPEIHEVIFNTKGGSSIEPIQVEDGNTLDLPGNPTRDGYAFIGWYEDETYEVPFDPSQEIHVDLTLYAKWNLEDEPNTENPNSGNDTEEDVEQKTYNLGDEAGNKISFIEDEGQDLELVIADISNLTDKEIEAMGITSEIYNNIKKAVLNGTKKYGTLLQYLNILVIDENSDEIDMSETPVTIKLLMNDEMKKYNSFKLVNFDVNEQFEVVLGNVITLQVKEIDGVKYLVGNLPHLSAYALVGDTVDTSTTTSSASNPKTYDGIMTWIVAFIISIVGIAVILIVNKKGKRK